MSYADGVSWWVFSAGVTRGFEENAPIGWAHRYIGNFPANRNGIVLRRWVQFVNVTRELEMTFL